jgi:hypothetical protein
LATGFGEIGYEKKVRYGPITDILIAQSSDWASWLAIVDRHIPEFRVPTGAQAAALVRSYLGMSDRAGMDLILSIMRHFGIKQTQDEAVDAGQGRARLRRSTTDLFQHHSVELSVGRVTNARYTSVFAHEIGHFFFACLCERAGRTFHNEFGGMHSEQFCWQFSLEILCPGKLRRLWNTKVLAEMLSERECADVAGLPRAFREFSFIHLRALARHYKITLRLLVRALDRHAMLNEAGMGIAIFRDMVNPNTGHERALRIYQRACPAWGYVICRQRATKQGFGEAETVWRDGSNQMTVFVSEKLRLRRYSDQGGPRWLTQELDALCAYTPVDVKTEARYLLAIWPWQALGQA